jgi:selenocysteine lyase/cysteine desulfurase
MLRQNGLTTARISARVEALQKLLLERLEDSAFDSAALLNPVGNGPHARFLAFRSPDAQGWCAKLAEDNCIVDVRGDVLRIGLGLYHDESDIERFAALAETL